MPLKVSIALCTARHGPLSTLTTTGSIGIITIGVSVKRTVIRMRPMLNNTTRFVRLVAALLGHIMVAIVVAMDQVLAELEFCVVF